jgi:hypothetical protein
MNATVAGVLAGLLVLILTIELLRRRQLSEKFAVLWIVISVAAMFFALFPEALLWISRTLGFQVPANLLFAVAALVLLAVSMQLSLEVGRLGDRAQRLAEEVGLLRLRVEELEAQQEDDAGTS